MTRRHRLNRGGDRQANSALHLAVISRIRIDEKTRAYVAMKTAEGHSKLEIIRCLKRYLAGEVFYLLNTPTDQLITVDSPMTSHPLQFLHRRQPRRGAGTVTCVRVRHDLGPDNSWGLSVSAAGNSQWVFGYTYSTIGYRWVLQGAVLGYVCAM